MQPRGFVSAVEIHEEVPFRGLHGYALVVIDHPLVVALHEIDLDAFYTPFFELIQGRIHMIFERLPGHPEDDADVLLPPVFNQPFQVDLGDGVEQVAGLDVVPAFVKDDVFQPVC